MEEYLQNVSHKYARKDASSGREMIYRTDFENLLISIFKADGKVTQINHDSTNDGGNKPDFVISKNNVPILYIEAKDIGVSLDKIEKSNQMERYFGYQNLVLTDYLEFRFYRNGEPYGDPVKIAEFDKDKRTISPLDKNFKLLEKTIVDFTLSHKEPIKKGKHLAQIMGGKAKRIRDNVVKMLESDSERYSDLLKIRDVVTENLVSNLTNDTFADMYAQTLVYGLFSARYNDKTLNDFSRSEARDLIPKTNPFLRSFFDHIAGTNFPERLRFMVDELCEVFTHADVEKILHDFYKKEKDDKDPIIHFYEDFLKEYDSKKKMEMGVFYTPKPVVQFIVRSVDELLKKEFGLDKGLADTSKISVDKKEINNKGKEVKMKKEYHKVQVLDVATGTGTFLNEVIENIYSSFKGQEGRWSYYVENDLLPRLHGFELMMASYTIAHLKLGMTLHETGVEKLDKRLGVYLTNTLEEPVDYSNQNTLFGLMDSIANESKNASRIKKEYPIMCVIGNPPYSGESMNKNYTDNDVYKVEPGGEMKLKERNSKWINDDYVKFIRFAESLVEKNGEGIMGMITAHGYIDNPTFRGMRWHLRKTFDKIYVVDLHGNSNKKEVSPDGSKDENVFDIKTGVSIIFGIKKSQSSKKLATVYKADIYGDRKKKFLEIESCNIQNIKWSVLDGDFDLWKVEGENKKEYDEGFSVNDLFIKSSVGIVTGRDAIAISVDKNDLINNVKNYLNDDNFDIDKEKILKINYRPFDIRYIYYDRSVVGRGRWELMDNFVNRDNVGLVCVQRSPSKTPSSYIFISKNILINGYIRSDSVSIDTTIPLYIYENNEKISNLKKEIWTKVNEIVGDTKPEDVLDYIYAVLHSPEYRDRFKEFLKTDFPRVPYPKNKDIFWKLAPLGKNLRELHLMISPECSNLITTYPEVGDDVVEKIKYENGNVFINEKQYFGNVPEIAWNFYIGGYQPAQKWLKDRKGKKLTNDDIEHYQKMVVVLNETNKIMSDISEIDFI